MRKVEDSATLLDRSGWEGCEEGEGMQWEGKENVSNLYKFTSDDCMTTERGDIN